MLLCSDRRTNSPRWWQFFWPMPRPDPIPRARRRRCVGSPATGCHGGGCSGWRWTKLRSTGPATPVICTTAAQFGAGAGSARAPRPAGRTLGHCPAPATGKWRISVSTAGVQPGDFQQGVDQVITARQRAPALSSGQAARWAAAIGRKRRPKTAGRRSAVAKIVAGGGKSGFCCAGLLRRRGWPLAGGCWRG